MSPKKVMIFGVFDLLHLGHLYLLCHARIEGQLIAVVARDSVVRRLKGVRPKWNQEKRMQRLKASGLVAKVVLGDAKEGSYAVIKKYHPDIICLGYDQKFLKEDLRAQMKAGRLPAIPLRILKPYQPVLFHTSLYRNGKNKR